MKKREHGIGEMQILTLFAALSLVGLWRVFGHDVRFDLEGTTGGMVQKLALFNASALVLLFSFAGWKYDLVGELKRREQTYGLVAIFCCWLLGNAMVLVVG